MQITYNQQRPHLRRVAIWEVLKISFAIRMHPKPTEYIVISASFVPISRVSFAKSVGKTFASWPGAGGVNCEGANCFN